MSRLSGIIGAVAAILLIASVAVPQSQPGQPAGTCESFMPGLGGNFCVENGSVSYWTPFTGDVTNYTGVLCSPTNNSQCGKMTVSRVNGQLWNWQNLTPANGSCPVWNASNLDWEPGSCGAIAPTATPVATTTPTVTLTATPTAQPTNDTVFMGQGALTLPTFVPVPNCPRGNAYLTASHTWVCAPTATATLTPTTTQTATATATVAPAPTCTPVPGDALSGNSGGCTYTPVPASLGLNVQTYGAKCDGVTDDKVAIQAAQTAAEALTPVGTLNFPPGKCVVSGKVIVAKGGRWTGAGPGLSSGGTGTQLFSSASNIAILAIEPSIATPDFAISGFSFNRQVGPAVTAGGDGIQACLTAKCGLVWISEVYFVSQWDGIHLGAVATQGWVHHVSSQENYDDGILIENENYTGGNLVTWNIDNSHFTDNNSYGMHVLTHSGYAGQSSIFLTQWTANQTNNNTLGGTYIDGSSGVDPLYFNAVNQRAACDGGAGIRLNYAGLTVASIAGGSVSGVGICATGVGEGTPASNLGTGILSNTSNSTISGVALFDISGTGISVSGSHVAITGNMVNLAGANGTAGTSLGIASSGVDNSITGNSSSGSKYGVSVSADFNTITGNDLVGNTTAGILITGGVTNGFIQENVGYNAPLNFTDLAGAATNAQLPNNYTQSLSSNTAFDFIKGTNTSAGASASMRTSLNANNGTSLQTYITGSGNSNFALESTDATGGLYLGTVSNSNFTILTNNVNHWLLYATGGLASVNATGGDPGADKANFKGYLKDGNSAVEWTLKTDGTLGASTSTAAATLLVACDTMVNAGTTANLTCTSDIMGTCTTAPTFNIRNNTQATTGTARACANTAGTSVTAQTLAFAAGDVMCLVRTVNGGTCTTSTFSVSAHLKSP